MVALCLMTLAAQAESWREDTWHYVCPDSPFFSPDRTQHHSAGVLTSDGGFALMVLGDPDQGALVSINVPGQTVQDSVTSTLVMPAGNILSRTVTNEQFWAAMTPDEASVTYTFRVDPADIEFFQAGNRWQVKAGSKTSNIPLKGSRIAINAALAARDRQALAEPETRP